jgi:hypothetical protein
MFGKLSLIMVRGPEPTMGSTASNESKKGIIHQTVSQEPDLAVQIQPEGPFALPPSFERRFNS